VFLDIGSANTKVFFEIPCKKHGKVHAYGKHSVP